MYSNILVPLDSSQLTEQALPYAEAIAHAFGSTLHIVQVVSPYAELGTALAGGLVSPDTSDLGLDLAQRMYQYQKSKGEAYLRNLESRLKDADVTVQTALLEGPTDESITEYILDADLNKTCVKCHSEP